MSRNAGTGKTMSASTGNETTAFDIKSLPKAKMKGFGKGSALDHYTVQVGQVPAIADALASAIAENQFDERINMKGNIIEAALHILGPSHSERNLSWSYDATEGFALVVTMHDDKDLAFELAAADGDDERSVLKQLQDGTVPQSVCGFVMKALVAIYDNMRSVTLDYETSRAMRQELQRHTQNMVTRAPSIETGHVSPEDEQGNASPADARFNNWRQLAANGNGKIANLMALMKLATITQAICHQELYFSEYVFPELTADAGKVIADKIDKELEASLTASKLGRSMDPQFEQEAMEAGSLETIIEQIVVCERALGNMTAVLDCIASDHVKKQQEPAPLRALELKEAPRAIDWIVDASGLPVGSCETEDFLRKPPAPRTMKSVMTKLGIEPAFVEPGKTGRSLYLLDFSEKLALGVVCTARKSVIGFIPRYTHLPDVGQKANHKRWVVLAFSWGHDCRKLVDAVTPIQAAVKDVATEKTPGDQYAEPM